MFDKDRNGHGMLDVRYSNSSERHMFDKDKKGYDMLDFICGVQNYLEKIRTLTYIATYRTISKLYI